jgi:hypothetical protein
LLEPWKTKKLDVNTVVQIVAIAPVVAVVREPVTKDVMSLVKVHAKMSVTKDVDTHVKVLVKTNVYSPAMEAVVEAAQCKHGHNKQQTTTIRLSEKHHLHRYEGLPVGLQILLSRGQEREGTDALGGGQNLHRLCARP